MLFELTAGMFILVVLLAFICEWIDSSLGMGYGTILSPALLILGLPALSIVPAILITQALGGLTAAIFHHKHGNASFDIKAASKNPVYLLRKIKQYGITSSIRKGLSDDLKVVVLITSFGVIATILAAFVAISISKQMLSFYIGALVLIMGILIIAGFSFRYTKKKMILVGVVSGFNKGISGGGFGPVVTGGQVVLGKDHKKAIATTTAAEPLITVTGFISHAILKGISGYGLIIALAIGAIVAGTIGPITTKSIDKQKFKKIVGTLMIALGLIALLKTLNLISISISI